MSTIGLSLVIHLLYIYNIDTGNDLHNLHSHCMYMCIMRGRLKLAVSECRHKIKSTISRSYRELQDYIIDCYNTAQDAAGAP